MELNEEREVSYTASQPGRNIHFLRELHKGVVGRLTINVGRKNALQSLSWKKIYLGFVATPDVGRVRFTNS